MSSHTNRIISSKISICSEGEQKIGKRSSTQWSDTDITVPGHQLSQKAFCGFSWLRASSAMSNREWRCGTMNGDAPIGTVKGSFQNIDF